MLVPSESVKRTRQPDGFQILLEIATFPLMYSSQSAFAASFNFHASKQTFPYRA
jgi:hypothetical protein